MENKLDVLTKKLYEEGVDKANQEAEKIIANAKESAAKLVAEAEAKALYSGVNQTGLNPPLTTASLHNMSKLLIS